MKQHKKYRVVIVEPAPVIQEGIKLFLERNPCFQITGCFSDLQSFENRLIKHDFHIVLLNPALVRFHRQYNIRTLFACNSDISVVAVVYQYVPAEMLRHFDGIIDIYEDGETIVRKLIKTIEAVPQKNSQPIIENIELSDREKDTLIALSKGLTNKEIADKLCISPHTVISHRKNIVRKTGIKTIAGLTLYALFNNLISQDDLP